jgi:hypothetical protein
MGGQAVSAALAGVWSIRDPAVVVNYARWSQIALGHEYTTSTANR